MSDTQNTLRDQLAEAVASVEIPAVEVKTETPVETTEPTQTASERARDEAGRFAKKQEEPVVEAAIPEAVETPKSNRPSTWKKDYWEKFDSLDPELQSYINQRESEYKTGVSTYRAEAERAKSLNEAIAPFIPTLQQHNIEPTQWIRNLGMAHQTLALGSPAQKMQMFQQLARDYGIDLSGQQMEQPQIDPQTQWLTQQVQALSQNWNSFQTKQQQTEQQQLQSEISKFAVDHPHFELVRADMAQILELGKANDLQSAYDKAIRMNDEAWQAEQERLSGSNLQQQAAAAAKAKSVAVSPKSATPSGTAKATTAKGLREQISAQLDAVSSRV